MLLVVSARAESPLGGERPDARQVPVELGREEARAAHLAVADDVDAGLLLVAQREVDRVVEHLGEVGRSELAALGRVDPGHEPGRPGVRADDARQQWLVTHRSTSAKANARAGLSTNRRRRAAASTPRSSSSAVKPREQPAETGRPAVDAVVALPRGVHPEDDPVAEAVLDASNR